MDPSRGRRRWPELRRRIAIGTAKRGKRWAATALAALCLFGPATAGAAAAGGSPSVGPGGWFHRYALPPGSQPWSIAVTPDGTVWTTLTGRRQLAALDPATGRWRFIQLPRGLAHPARLIAGPDGSLWLTDNDYGTNPADRLWRYRPPAAGGATPAEPGATGDSGVARGGTSSSGSGWQAVPLPFAGASAVLAAGDAVWVLQFQGNHLGRLDPETGRIDTFNLPLPGYPWPSGWDLDMDRAGRLWTVSPRSGTVYRFDPAEGEWASFPLPPDVAGPAALAVTPAGDGVWVSEHGGRTIGRLDVATRAWVPVQTPPAPPAEEIEATRPNDLEWDEQGFLWVALHTGNALARIDPSSGTLELFPFPAAEPKTWVQWLARAPGGSLWFAAFGRDYVGRVDPAALPPLQLSATVAEARLAPGGSTTVRLALVRPQPAAVGGSTGDRDRGAAGTPGAAHPGAGEPAGPPAAGGSAPAPGGPGTGDAAAAEPAGAAGAGGGPAGRSGPATGAVEWTVFDVPRGWGVQWEERGRDAARARIVVPRDTEAGVYPLVVAAQVGGRGLVTRTVRVQVAAGSALPWSTLAGFGALVGALVVGWMGVLAGVQAQRRRSGGGGSAEGPAPTG